MRLYGELAPWFHLLTHLADYADEAAYYTRIIDAVSEGRARTLLELGSGGGNNASHLKAQFDCTLTDLSAEMLELSATINPECEHVRGDMRTLRLGRTFDAVFVHDAVMYMTTEGDLRAVVETAAAHAAPGGVVLLVPDTLRETFSPGVDHGGHDGPDGRSLRYLEWTRPPDADGTTFEVDFAIMLREPGSPVRVVHDHHVFGLFARDTWLGLMAGSGLEPVEVDIDHPHPGEFEVFAARGAPLDAVRKDVYPRCRTYVRHRDWRTRCSRPANRRSGSSSPTTSTSTATHRRFGRSARQSGSPRRPRCTHISQASSARV